MRVEAMWLKVVCSLLSWQQIQAYNTISNFFPKGYGPLNQQVLTYEPVHTVVLSQQMRRSTEMQSVPIVMNITAFGTSFTIRLNKASFLNNFRALSNTGREHVSISLDNLPIYEGHVIGQEATSRINGHVHDSVFEGVIHTEKETYHIEASSKHFKNSPTFPAVIYRERDVVFPPSNLTDSSAMDRLKDWYQTNVLEKDRPDDSKSRPLNHIRQKRASATLNTCNIIAIADHTFFADMGFDRSKTISEMLRMMNEVDGIFRNNDIGLGYNIRVKVQNAYIFETQSIDNPVRLVSSKAEDVLQAFSAYNLEKYCLAHLFTSRLFEGGTLGLAWVGGPGTQAGVCAKAARTRDGIRYLNTGLTTNKNAGFRISSAVMITTIAHELGHNYGSAHDAVTGDDSCSPQGNQGKFIMFPTSTDGSRPNNRLFSPCSKASMRATVQSSGGSCFAEWNDEMCGNGVIEGKEQCDCGMDSICSKDNCCTNRCTLKAGAQCHVQRALCCDVNTCSIAGQGTTCIAESSCLEAATCNGLSFNTSSCSTRKQKDDKTICDDAYTCFKGACDPSRSVCAVFGLQVCEGKDQCVVSCKGADGICHSTKDLALPTSPNRLPKAYFYPTTRSCGLQGFCSGTGVCNIQRPDTADNLEEFFNDLFNTMFFKDTASFFRVNWVYFAAVGGSSLVIFILTVNWCLSERSTARLRRTMEIQIAFHESKRQKEMLDQSDARLFYNSTDAYRLNENSREF